MDYINFQQVCSCAPKKYEDLPPLQSTDNNSKNQFGKQVKITGLNLNNFFIVTLKLAFKTVYS